jgi:hypothetical protein
LKQINKEKILEKNKIDSEVYNADKVYKIVKNNKVDFEKLNKETLLSIILNDETTLEELSTVNCDLISRKSEKLTAKKGKNTENQSFLSKKRQLTPSFNIIINKSMLQPFSSGFGKVLTVKNKIIINETEYSEFYTEIEQLRENLKEKPNKNVLNISCNSSFTFVN